MIRFRWIFFSLFVVANVALVYFAVINPVTFTELAQNPQATTEKYKDTWDDTDIVEKPFVQQSHPVGDIIATLTIPKLEIYEMPIYYGTTDENKNWQFTTPGYEGNWQLFGEYGLAAIGAHNYQLFANLDDLVTGDQFIVETPQDVYVYTVTDTQIYDHKDSWEEVVYAGKEPYSVVLITCYPFDAVDAQDRFVVFSSLQSGTIYPNGPGEKMPDDRAESALATQAPL